MKKLFLTAALVLATGANAQPDPTTLIPLDPAFRTGQLDNGLTWYLRANDEPEQRAFLNLIVKVGSLQEDEDQLGLAHFLEHMAFNGTENFEKQELINYLETIGMEFGPEINAYTNFDETVYMLTIPTDDPEFLEQGFRILSDWSRRLLIEEEEVERERGVVMDEWRGRLGAGQRIFEEESKLLYAGSRYVDRMPIGDPDIIGSAESPPIRRFYESWYRPDLMAIVAVGDFDEERILQLIHENFDESWGPDKPRELVGSEVEPHEETLWGILQDPELTRSTAQVLLKFEQGPVRTMEEYREAVVVRLAQSMFASRMRELVEQNQADFTGARVGARRLSPGWSTWTLTVSAADGELEPALQQALIEWERAREHGFTQTELDRNRTSRLRFAETRYKDRENQESSRLARRLTSVFQERGLLPGPEWTLRTYEELLPQIELADIQALVKQIDFSRVESRVMLTNTPEREGLALPTREGIEAAVVAAASADLEPWVDEVQDEPLVSGLPEPGEIIDEQYDGDLDLTTWTLSNGVTVLVKPTDFNEDRFSLEAFSPGGTSLGTEDGDVSEDFAATFVSAGGVGAFDRSALSKRLTGKIAQTNAWINLFEEGFSGGGSPDDLETVMQLLWLRATQPRRGEAAFTSLVDRFATMIENRAMNPDQVYSDSLKVILNDYHPRAMPLDVETLRTADLDRSLEFYRERFEDLDDLIVVIVGAVELDGLRPLVEQYIATLPATDREETWQDTGVRWIDGPLHRVIEAGVDEKARTTLMMYGDAEWTRLRRYQINALAAALDIRLREVLREDLSGTYGVSVGGSVQPRPEPYWSLAISFGCDPERLDELVAQTVAVLEEVRDQGLDASYMEKVREQDLRSLEENVRRNGYWSSVLSFRARYGLDQRDVLRTREFLEGFGPEQFREAVQLYIHTDQIVRFDKVPATDF